MREIYPGGLCPGGLCRTEGGGVGCPITTIVLSVRVKPEDLGWSSRAHMYVSLSPDLSQIISQLHCSEK